MGCQRTREYLYPFIDGELDSQDVLLVKEHLSNCPLCELEWKEEKKMDSLIRQNIPKENAPYTLKEAIIDGIEGLQKPKVFSFGSPILRLSFVAILVILLVTIPAVFKKARSFPLFSESISRHIKCLQGAFPMEVISNNPQDIKKWFEGKLDFVVMVPDLSRSGINLIGARLCHLKDRKVAYLMYEKNGQNISVFVIDVKGLNIQKANRIVLGKSIFLVKNEKGYNSILCLEKEGDIGCIFVSDLPKDELIKMIT